MAKKKPASKKANAEAPKRMSASSATKTKKEVRQGSRTPKMAKRSGFPRLSLPQGWFSALVFFLVCVFLFYPPYFRGLFFDKELLPTHVITALIYGLVWVDKFRRRDLRFIQNPLDYAVLAYAGAYLLSLIGAVHIGDAIKGFLKALDYFMIYWMVTQVVRDYRRYETVLQVLFASALGVAAIGIAAATGYSHYPGAFEDGRIMSTLQYPNTTATYMAVMSLIGVVLWIRERNTVRKLIYAVSTTIMVLVAIVAVSKGGWLVLVAGALLLLAGMPGLYRLKTAYSLFLAWVGASLGSIKFLPAVTAGQNRLAFEGLLVTVLVVILGQLLWEGLVWCYRKKGRVLTAGVALVILLICAAVAVQGGWNARISREVLPTSLASRFAQLGDVTGSSYISRLEFNYTAMRIVKDYPLVGTGAGGWNALYHQYQGYPFWTTEVHNHFLQVWVEAGTTGFIAFLVMWAFLAYNLWRLYRSRPPQGEWAMNWGVASAALAFGAHAAIDFDLSLAAMAMVLWTFFALVAAGTNLSCPGIRITRKEPGWLPAVAVVTALILLIPAASFARANTWVERGADAANHNKFDQAEEAMNRAINLNPWDGRFDAYLAKICAVKYKVLAENKHPQAGVYVTAAREHAQDSERLRPYDLQNLKELLQTYSLLGDVKGQLHVLEQCLKTNPLDSANYLNLADAYLTVGKYYLDQKKPDEARRYLTKVVQVSDQLDRKIAAVQAEYPLQSSSFRRPGELDKKVEEAKILLKKS
ncbi:MAG: O-antigen ligase family protein [Syntrophothermus sp.]|uniref:O-antigen ligase family protein n=1 Tax=Syntrophothermus sp. TaxID=2736299 RepID=UPI00257A90C4|nr:O-antigen ligase family protein [Syntrophothermus sp.]NSW82988.1 O-antigen ligase family protein [Syntrophothermus sp.]